MIADAVARIQAIELELTEKTQRQLQARLSIRGCLKELRNISNQASKSDLNDGARPAH